VEKNEAAKYLLSRSVINEIILNKMPDMKITQISYDSATKTGKTITLRGIAPSRERLLQFRKALEDDSAFKKVDLPISNFVKGSNISFSIGLLPS
jgi:Tfp pilus assembly protein PilN